MWKVDPRDSWDKMYNALCWFAQAKRDEDENKYWNGCVLGKFETGDKPSLKLGRWIKRCKRTNYKFGKKTKNAC